MGAEKGYVSCYAAAFDSMGIAMMRAIPWQKALLLIVVFAITGCRLAWSRPTAGTLEEIASAYRVSEEKVREVALAYGAEPEQLITYGPYTFPVNYIVMAMEEVGRYQGYVAKEDVEAIVRGYEVRCELEPWLVYYLFYATNVRPDWRRQDSVAMVLTFVYRQDDRPTSGWIVDNWQPVNLLDHAGFLTDRAEIEERCLKGRSSMVQW